MVFDLEFVIHYQIQDHLYKKRRICNFDGPSIALSIDIQLTFDQSKSNQKLQINFC